MSTVLAVLRLPWYRKRLLIEAVVLMALARMAVLTLPFHLVSKAFGQPGAQTPDVELGAADVRVIRSVRGVLRRLEKRVPWTSKCLDQALAGKIMLARRGISSTMYFGVKTTDRGEIDAHAWLRSGSVYVSGGLIRSRYRVINTFADMRNG